MTAHLKMGVVADDVTGANDIGIMFAKSGYRVHVYSFKDSASFRHATDLARPDVAILDTNSRLDPPRVAYDKVLAATHQLRDAGCRQYFNKTCSVLRGNVGPEFDAMLDALDQEFALVVAGFPKNGRLTRNGVHYVHGLPLAESEFRHDPVQPMTRSNLVDILQAQTARPVALLDHTVVAQGAAALRREIESMRRCCQYLILDVVDQAALTTIAHAAHDLPVLCGSSALAEELPAVWGTPAGGDRPARPPAGGGGVLCVAGSLMPQTLAQVQHLRARGMPTCELDTLRLFDPGPREATLAAAADALAAALAAGDDALLYAAHSPAAVEATRAAGAARGLARAAVSRLVSGALAEVTARLAARCSLSRLVVAGGETSAAVCDRLGIDALRIDREIQPGLPSCLSLGPQPWQLVLKSGSFGTDAFMAQAVAHLRE